MPYVNGEYVMPGGDDLDMFAPWLGENGTGEAGCIDPLCDECILPQRKRQRRPAAAASGATTGAAAQGATTGAATSGATTGVAGSGNHSSRTAGALEAALKVYNQKHASREHWQIEEASEFCGGSEKSSRECMQCDMDFKLAFRLGRESRYLLNVRTEIGVTQKLCETCIGSRLR